MLAGVQYHLETGWASGPRRTQRPPTDGATRILHYNDFKFYSLKQSNCEDLRGIFGFGLRYHKIRHEISTSVITW